MKNSFFRILILALIISIAGVLSIYSSTYQKEGVWQGIYMRQMLWLGIGLVCFFIASGFNYRKLWDANYFIGFA